MAEKTIQALGDLIVDPLDSRKTRSQFHNALSTCDSIIPESLFIMVGSYLQSYEEELYDPIWKTTMKEEFNSLQDNETWELVLIPSKRKLVQCKWVYRTNMVADGLYLKYNSMLVSKVFSQVNGLDYIETFSPIAKMNSIRIVLAIAASKH